MPRGLGYLLAAAALAGGWQLASDASGGLIPGPAPAAAYLASHPLSALVAVAQTLEDAIGGYAVALALTLLSALLAELGAAGRELVDGVKEALHAVTPLSWSLALLIMLGFSNRLVPVLVSALSAYPVLATSAVRGVEEARVRYGELEAWLRMGPLSRLAHVDLPASLPFITSGSRSAIGVALIVSPVAEAFGTAGGIGYGLYLFFELHEYAAFEAWTLLLLAVMVALDRAVLEPLERWGRRWAE